MIKLNYFSIICFVWAAIGLCSRLMIKLLGARWKDWEENQAYTDKKPKWLVIVDVLAIIAILFTWHKVFVSDIRGSWIIASLMTLLLVKGMLQLFQYNQFKAFVNKAMRDEKLFKTINIGVLVLSACLIGLGIFYIK